MRHRKRGRRLGRSSSHRKAMLKNLASSLLLTEREVDELEENSPKVQGRVVTTLHKAKEVRPLIERCVTIARKVLQAERDSEQYATDAERASEEYRTWRKSDDWQKWAEARGPVVAARRRCVQLLGDKDAVTILFDTVAPRFEDRPGGYTRILRLAQPRLGDAGERAILEFVGKNDRTSTKSVKPAFDMSDDEGDDREGDDDGNGGEEEKIVDEVADSDDAGADAGDEKSIDETIEKE
jgi:large subunit ribosomal protein L17